MSWSIANIDNNVKISPTVAQALFDAQQYEHELWYELEDVTEGDQLFFNEDHREWMDWVCREHFLAVLCAHKVQGDITFGSLEGDNAGKFWGYRFDGQGGYVNLVGKVTFEPALEEGNT